MSESERGRWFLDEYSRRNRSNDTGILLDAIKRLETVVTADRDGDRFGRLRGDVMDMVHAIARTKAEIAAIQAPEHDKSRLGGASEALDAIVRSTERATSDILEAAEHVQETAWNLRESGSDASICDELDRRATAIYTACSFQDLTAQRTARIIHTLRYLEDRLTTMMGIWGDVLEPVPGEPDTARVAEVPADLCQSDVDRYLDMESSAAEPVPPPDPSAGPVPESPSVADDIVFREATDAVADAVPADQAPADSASATSPEPVTPHATVTGWAEPEAVDPSAASDTPLDEVAATMASAAAPEPVLERTDIASAFADIDALSEDEKRALFS